MVAYHGEPTKQNVEYWIKKKTGNNYIQPFSALAPQIIAIKESVPLTEKNKMPSQPYFLEGFSILESFVFHKYFLIYNIEFKSLSRFYYFKFCKL